MRRIALCVVAMVLPLAMLGCGSSSESGENQVPGEVQYQLGQNAQGQLQRAFHDTTVRIANIRCARLAAGIGTCVLEARDGSGQRGNVSIAVRLEKRTHAVQAQLAGTTNKHWMRLLQREARAQAQSQTGEAGTTPKPRTTPEPGPGPTSGLGTR